MADEERKITALDRVVAKPDVVHLGLMIGEDRINLDMNHKTALDIVQTIADALTQLKSLDSDHEKGVALYEATKFEAEIERIPGRLGLQEKFVLTANAQGATKITLRLDPSKVDEFIADLEQHSIRKRTSKKQ